MNFRYTTAVHLRIFLTGLLALLVPVATAAADLSGIWTGTWVDRNGDPQDLSVRLVQKGESLSGKMYGDNESLPLTALKISGNQLSFSVTVELNGQVSLFLYSGSAEGNQMELSRVRVDGTSAQNPAAAAKPAPAQTFRLKRLT